MFHVPGFIDGPKRCLAIFVHVSLSEVSEGFRVLTICQNKRPFNNGKGFSKISKPTEQIGAYHLQFDFL